MKKIVKSLFILSFFSIFAFLVNVNAAEVGTTNEYFKTSRTNGRSIQDESSVKKNLNIPNDYSFALGGTVTSYETNGASALSNDDKRSWLDNNGDPILSGLVNVFTDPNYTVSKADDSVKGNFYVLYKGTGSYNNRPIDVKLTVVDFSESSGTWYEGKGQLGNPVPVIYISNDKIGVSVSKLDWIKVKFEFFEEGTNTPVNIKGYTTYWDIDLWQGLHFLDGNAQIYASTNSGVHYTEINGAPYIYDTTNENNTTNLDSSASVTETFSGSEMNIVYTFARPTPDTTSTASIYNAYGGISTSTIINRASKEYAEDTPSGANGSLVEVDDIIKYNIQYTNNNPDRSASVTITDTLSKGLEYVSNSSNLSNPTITNKSDGSTVLKWQTTIPAETSRNLTYSVRVTEDAESIVSNDAVVDIGTYHYDLPKLENDVLLRGRVIVRHLEEGTNKVLYEQQEFTKNFDESYTTSSKEDELLDYTLVGVPDNASGVVNTNQIIVTYYYKLKEGRVIARYLEEGTNLELLDQTEETKKYTEEYTTSSKENELPNYRLVSTVGDPTGIVHQDLTVVVYYFKQKQGELIVHHYLKNTTTKLAEDELYTKNYGDSYTTSNKQIANHVYDSSAGDPASGTINKDNTEVIYYYAKKVGTVITKHLEKGTNRELASEVVNTYDYGDTYTTTSVNVGQNYNLDSVSGDVSGVVDKDSTEVIYYYVKKATNINDSIQKTGTDKITSRNDLVSYKVDYSVDITDYIGPVTITLTDKLPYKIDQDKSTLDGGTYNDSSKTITWVQNISNYNSYNDDPITITKNLKLAFTNIDASDRVMVNEVIGEVETDNDSSNIIAEKPTTIQIPGTVTVLYVDEEGNEIASREVTQDLVGEIVDISAKDIDGYNLIKKPDSEVITIVEGNTECKYVYEKIKYNIITKALTAGGTITGDEIVPHGKDSKKNVTMIAKDGYYIDYVKINGKLQKIKKNSKKIVLPTFKKVTENKLIEVAFKKAPEVIKIPDTGSTISIIEIVGGIALISAGGYVFYKKYLPNLKKKNG